MTELSTMELSRPSERMCWPKFASSVGESMIVELHLPKGGGSK